jgi:hypothetical protein
LKGFAGDFSFAEARVGPLAPGAISFLALDARNTKWSNALSTHNDLTGNY